MLRPGDPAPDVRLPDDAGASFDLAAYRGHRLVLFFYAKDATPG